MVDLWLSIFLLFLVMISFDEYSLKLEISISRAFSGIRSIGSRAIINGYAANNKPTKPMLNVDQSRIPFFLMILIANPAVTGWNRVAAEFQAQRNWADS